MTDLLFHEFVDIRRSCVVNRPDVLLEHMLFHRHSQRHLSRPPKITHYRDCSGTTRRPGCQITMLIRKQFSYVVRSTTSNFDVSWKTHRFTRQQTVEYLICDRSRLVVVINHLLSIVRWFIQPWWFGEQFLLSSVHQRISKCGKASSR